MSDSAAAPPVKQNQYITPGSSYTNGNADGGTLNSEAQLPANTIVTVIKDQNMTSNAPNPYKAGTRLLRKELLEFQKIAEKQGGSSDSAQSSIAFVPNRTRCMPRINVYRAIEAAGVINYGNTIIFKMPSATVSRSDMVLELKIGAWGGAVSTTAQGATTYFYCDYPGVRLCAQVTHKRRNRKWDEYYPYDVMYYRQFELAAAEHDAWDRNMGQQTRKSAMIYQPDAQIYTESYYFDGPQTPKTRQPELTLMIPIIIQACESEDDALYAGGDAFESVIEVLLESPEKIFWSRNYNTYASSPLSAPSAPQLISATLHVNELSPIDDSLPALSKLIGQPIPWRTRFSFTTIFNSVSNDLNILQLDKLREITTAIYVGFRALTNINYPQTWHKYGTATPSVNGPTYIPGSVIDLNNQTGPQLLARLPLERMINTPLVTDIGFRISDIDLSKLKSGQFYRDYLPSKQPHDRSSTGDPDAQSFAMYFGTRSGRDCNGSIDLRQKNNLYLVWNSATGGQIEIVISAEIIRYQIQ
jgi:hypothetical protein